MVMLLPHTDGKLSVQVAVFVLPSSRDESELSRPCYSPDPHLWNGWLLPGRKLVAGNHFLHVMLSALCGCCCQRGWWKLGKLLFISSSSWCVFLLRESQKRKGGCSRQVASLSLFGQSPAVGSCFCGCGVHEGNTIHVLVTAAHKPAEAAGRWNTKTLGYKIFKESCEFGFLLMSSPDLYFNSFAEGPESNQR